MLENSHDLYRMNRYNSSEFSGQAFYEALERYKRYERKLVDTIKPIDETLTRLSGAPPHHAPSQFAKQAASQTSSNAGQSGGLRSSFSIFPNGQKDAYTSEALLNNDDEDSVSSPPKKSGKHVIHPSRPISHNPYLKKQLPVLIRNQNKSAYNNGRQQSTVTSKSLNLMGGSRTRSAAGGKGKIKQVDYYDEDEDSAGAEGFEEEEEEEEDDDDESEVELCNDDKEENSKSYYKLVQYKKSSESSNFDEKSVASSSLNGNVEVKYDLPLLIKQLEEGFYIR
jgi:hypothetical protein